MPKRHLQLTGSRRNSFESRAWILRRLFDYYGMQIEERIVQDGDKFRLMWALPPMSQPIVNDNPNPLFWQEFTSWYSTPERSGFLSEIDARLLVKKAFEDFWLCCKYCNAPVHRHYPIPKQPGKIACQYPMVIGEGGTYIRQDLQEFAKGDSELLIQMRKLLV